MRLLQAKFVCGMLVGAGLLGSGLVLGGADGDDRLDAPRVLRAQSIEIVDEIGTVQLALGLNKDGGTMSVRDRFGRTILLLGAAEHGGVLVVKATETGQPAFIAGTSNAGGAIQVFDRAGVRVVDALATSSGGQLTVATSSGVSGTGQPARGRPAVRLETSAGGAGELACYGPSGRLMTRVSPDAVGGGVIETFDGRTDRPLVAISSTAAGHGQVRTTAPGGQTLVTLTATANDEGQIYTYDGAGRPLIAIASRSTGPTLRVFNRSGNPIATLESDEGGNGTVSVFDATGVGRTLGGRQVTEGTPRPDVEGR